MPVPVKTSTNRSRRSDQFCPVWFERLGTVHCGFLANLSATGARIVSLQAGRHAHPYPGEKIKVVAWTPLGVGSCQGEVKWSERNWRESRWGMEITKFDPDENDPLRRYIADQDS